MKRVAVLLADQFEDVEFRVPVELLREFGWDIVVVGLRAGETLNGRSGKFSVVSDAAIAEFLPEQFHGVLVPGGPSARALGSHPDVVGRVKYFHLTGHPLAAIGDGVSVLAAAHIGERCKVASPANLRKDLERLGASCIDDGVAVEGHLVTAPSAACVEDFAFSFLRCLIAAEQATSPREVPPEMPPLG